MSRYNVNGTSNDNIIDNPKFVDRVLDNIVKYAKNNNQLIGGKPMTEIRKDFETWKSISSKYKPKVLWANYFSEEFPSIANPVLDGFSFEQFNLGEEVEQERKDVMAMSRSIEKTKFNEPYIAPKIDIVAMNKEKFNIDDAVGESLKESGKYESESHRYYQENLVEFEKRKAIDNQKFNTSKFKNVYNIEYK